MSEPTTNEILGIRKMNPPEGPPLAPKAMLSPISTAADTGVSQTSQADETDLYARFLLYGILDPLSGKHTERQFKKDANKLNVDEAMGWLNQSIKVKETLGNVGLKARVLAEQGKMAEAIAAGERAIQVGKDAKANPQGIANMEKLVAEWKAKKS